MHRQNILSVPIFLASLALLLLTCTGTAFAQSDECADGFVWREAFPDDHVCVIPEVRERVKEQNRNAGQYTTQGGAECTPGYVFRMAGPRDQVCVTEDERDQAQQDNR